MPNPASKKNKLVINLALPKHGNVRGFFNDAMKVDCFFPSLNSSDFHCEPRVYFGHPPKS